MGVRHVRVTLLGSISGGADNWSTSFSAAPVGPLDFGGMADTALAAALAFDNAAAGMGLFAAWNPSTVFRGAKAAVIAADGHTEVSAESILTTPHAGGSGSPALPPEVSVVCSLRTTTPGPRGRGRMYLPAPDISTCSANGNVSVAHRLVVMNTMEDFVNHFNSTTPGGSVSVASNAGVFVTVVTELRVGNVFDSQRRRRDRIAESYIRVAITP